jgi:hypothetical protein
MQSQPAHIEILPEKLGLRALFSKIAQEFTIPLGPTRGPNSMTRMKDIANRFAQSGKGKMIILGISDLDPAGDMIVESTYKVFRRDFGISPERLEVYKVALTIEQVRSYGLAPSMEAKASSPTYKAFCAKYGIRSAYELEAFAPGQLAGILRDAIEQVIDLEAFNAELERERADSVKLAAIQSQIREVLKNLDHPDEDSS